MKSPMILNPAGSQPFWLMDRCRRPSLWLWATLFLLGQGLVSGGPAAPGRCVVVITESKSVTTNHGKCGTPEFYFPPGPERPRWYCTNTTTITSSSSYYNSGGEGGTNYSENGGSCTITAGSWFDSYAMSYAATTVLSCDRLSSVATNVLTGAYTERQEGEDTRTWDCYTKYGANGLPCTYKQTYIYGFHSTSETPKYLFLDGGWRWKWVGLMDAAVRVVYETNSCTYEPVNAWTNTFGYTNDNPCSVNPQDLLDGWTPTHLEYDDLYLPGAHKVVDLSDEYTDDQLHTNILDLMPPVYPGVFAEDPKPTATSYIRVDHAYGELVKIKFRFGVVSSQPRTTYKITYDLVTAYPDNTTNVEPDHATVVYGTGDKTTPAYSAEIEQIPRPFWQGPTTNDNTVKVTVENVRASIVARGISLPGSGPVADRGSSCAGCQGRGPFQAGGTGTGAVAAEFGLGQALSGLAAGSLRISWVQPSPALATTTNLACASGLSGVDVIKVNGQVRQVLGPQTLADIVTIDPLYKYEIRFYLPSQVGTKSGDTYPVSGDPFVKWTVENPDTSGATCNQLRLTETRGSAAKVHNYTYTDASSSWKYSPPGGASEEVAATAFDPVNQTRTVTTTVRKPAGADALKVRRKYQFFSWGEALVEETLSPDENPRTTTYRYYDWPDLTFTPRGTLIPLREVIHPDGSWEFYDYDNQGRTADVYSGVGNQPAPGPAEYPSGTYRYTWYGYGPNQTPGSGDDTTLDPYSPRQTIEYSPGQIVAMSYLVELPGEQREIRCRHLADWNDSHNLVTITKYYTSGENLNRIQSVQNPDGTMAIYQYVANVDGTETDTVDSGQPNGGKTAIIDGTRTVTVTGALGQVISHTVSDIASGVTLASETYSNFDDFGRPGRVTYLDGTHEDTQYACCGVDNTTDRDGVVTQFRYDDLRRQAASTRLGITTTNVLDAAGQVLKTIRIGSDNSQIVLSQTFYDLAGQVTNEINALNGSTTYAQTTNSAGQRVRIVTYPDGGTRVETNYLDGSAANLTGTAVQPARYESGVDADGLFSKQINLNLDGTDSGEWTKTYTDFLGRDYKTVYADSAFSQSFYDDEGQLWKQRDPDNVVTLYQYNAKAEPEYSATDVNRDDQINFAGTDRITRTVSSVELATCVSGMYVNRTRTYLWTTDGADTLLCVATNEVSTNGLRTWSFTAAGTNQSQTVYGTGGYRYVTNTAPDGTYAVSVYQNGRLLSVTRKDSGGNQLSSVSYSYDAHGRQNGVTDARTGTTSYTFNNADQILTVTTPSPGVPQAPQVTTTSYDTMLRATNTVEPDGAGLTNQFLPTGQLKKTWGARVYPVEYTYDYAGRVATMKTWQNFAGNSGAALTTWNYNAQRGWLENKRYADGSGPDYTYTPGGRLKSRIWARTGTGSQRIATTNTYGFDDGVSGNEHGDLVGVSYANDPQSTPALTYTFDRRGRQKTVAQGAMTTSFAYNDADELLSESYAGGTLAGLSVTNGYDALLRRTNLVLRQSTTPLIQQSMSWDAASRLQTVSDGNGNSATYIYLANSPLVSQILFTNNGARRMTTTKAWDNLNRLTQISSVPSVASVVSFSYGYNAANQRIRRTDADGSYWRYEYDALGQVRSGRKYWSDGTPVAGQQFEYAHDDIGNRTSSKAGGDASGAGLRVAGYSPNSLSQYTARDVPGAVDIMGLGFATNAVTVNGTTAYRKGEYFRQQVNVSNGSIPVWQGITVTESGQTSVSGNLFVPQSPEQFAYDLDGNLLSDGRWSYTWDAENRLIAMAARTPVGPQISLKFEYDSKGRRIRKQVWNNTTWSGNPANDLEFIYDGWNLLAESATGGALVRSYVWGSDLSGSMQGAGGAGGLLQVSYYGTQTTNCFAAYDGNGNVAALVNAADGKLVSQYEYGPFGELLRVTGPVGKVNPFRFSTKYQDDETDLVYYGYRYYSPSTGRWASRDPSEEEGGADAYACLNNDSLNYTDPMGLCKAVVRGGVRYRVSIAALDAWYRPGTPYKNLATFAANYAASKYPPIQFKVKVPRASGPYTMRSKALGKIPSGNFTGAHFLVFVDWEVDDPNKDCRIRYTESATFTPDDHTPPQTTHINGVPREDAVTWAKRTKYALPGCTDTLIYVDTPGNLAVKKAAVVNGYPYAAYGFTMQVRQTTTLWDSTTGDDVDTVDWGISITVDRSGNLKN